MIFVECERCEQELVGQGGLMFGPPVETGARKIHLCIKCWYDVLQLAELEL